MLLRSNFSSIIYRLKTQEERMDRMKNHLTFMRLGISISQFHLSYLIDAQHEINECLISLIRKCFKIPFAALSLMFA